MEYSPYLTSSDIKGQQDHYIDIGLNLKKKEYFNNWFYGAEFNSVLSLDESDQKYLSVPDLFIGYKYVLNGYNFNVVLGRQTRLSKQPTKESKKPYQAPEESWSFMDEIWGLGLWQGTINWDYFHPKALGLTGSFFTVAKDEWLLTVFLSGFFLPSQGPSVDIQDGKVSSGSRWFASPQSEFVFFNQSFESFYWMKRPYLKNVILNDSVALRFRFGKIEHQWFSLSYAYKPVNQTYFKIDGSFSINKKAVDSVIYYQSFKHSLISLDFGIRKGLFNTVISVTQETPSQPPVPENWIAPVLPKALFFSSHAEVDLQKYRLPVKTLEFNFLYSRFMNQSESISTGGGQIQLDLNINRFKLYRGIAFSAKSRKFYIGSQILSAGVSYWYSFPEQGGWLNMFLKWRIDPNISIESRWDIVGADGEAGKDSFFKLYRQNDRAQIRVTYDIKN